jgi:TRAP-type C4-dicarboxylate transport system substrate-binding protein
MLRSSFKIKLEVNKLKWFSFKSGNTRTYAILSIFIALTLLAIPFSACSSTPSTTTPAITLTMVSAWSSGVAFNDKLMIWIANVNKNAKGKVFIDFKGGPEVAPITEAVGLVKKGTYDLCFSSPGYYGGLSPSCVPFYYLPEDPVKLRALGVHDLADKIMRDEMQISFLGWVSRGEPFTIVSKKEIKTADFKGILMHTLPMFTAAITSLGASTKTLQVGEFYQALQTGTVDAVPCPAGTVPMDYKLYEQAKYILYPLIPITTSGEVMINAAKFDSLPADVQKLLKDEMIKIEKEVYPYYSERTKGVIDQLIAKGMVKSTLPKAEADKFLYAFNVYAWEQFKTKNPKWVPQLYDLVKNEIGK